MDGRAAAQVGDLCAAGEPVGEHDGAGVRVERGQEVLFGDRHRDS